MFKTKIYLKVPATYCIVQCETMPIGDDHINMGKARIVDYDDNRELLEQRVKAATNEWTEYVALTKAAYGKMGEGPRRKTSRITTKTLLNLLGFRYNATNEEFRDIFGNMGDHLWQKFNIASQDLMKFYQFLDDENLEKLADYLAQKYERMPE